MPMGVVDDTGFAKELESLDKPLPSSKPFSPIIKDGEVVDAATLGRGVGNKAVPESLKKLIGEEANINGRASALGIADSLGISHSSVSAYTNAANSTASYNTPNPAIKSQITKARERISRKARGVLLRSMDNITDEKLIHSKAIDLSTIAKNMSSIVRDMTEDESGSDRGNTKAAPAIVIIAPHPISEDKFETVRVNE